MKRSVSIALSIILSSLTSAAEQSSQVVAGEISNAGSGTDGFVGDFTWNGSTTGSFTTVLGSGIDLRYRIWSGRDQPVWHFVARVPAFREIHLSEMGFARGLLSIIRAEHLAPGEIQWHPDPNAPIASGGVGHGTPVWVAPDVMDRAAFTAFGFQLNVDPTKTSPIPGEKSDLHLHGITAIYQAYDGIIAASGRWGWNVPWSPDWSQVFMVGSHNPAFTPESYSPDHPLRSPLSAEDAQELMRILVHNAYDTPDGKPDEVFFILQTGGYGVDLSGVLHAIAHKHPEALRALYRIDTRRQQDVFNLVHAFNQRRISSGDSDDLASRKALIDRVMDELGAEIPAVLRADWAGQARTGNPDDQGRQCIQAAMDRWEALMDQDPSAIPKDQQLARSVAAADRHFAANPSSPLASAWARAATLFNMRQVWVVATASTELLNGFALIIVSEEESRRRNALTAEQRRREDERFERLRNDRRRRDQRLKPPPVHTQPFSVSVPRELDEAAVADVLRQWASDSLASTQQITGRLEHYDSWQPRCSVHVFSSQAAAKEWTDSQDSRLHAAPAPPQRVEAPPK